MKEDFSSLSLKMFGAPLIIGLAVILSTIIGSMTFYSIKNAESSYLSVTGSAKKAVVSDQVKWMAQFSRRVYLSQLKSGYSQMAKDLSLVKGFYKEHGLNESDLTISPVYMDEIYDYKNEGSSDKQYNLRQTILVNSSDVLKTTELAKQTQSLINQGVLFSTMNLEYFYSKLPELRVSMLADAVKDAKARAETIAKSGDKRIGFMKSASSGVVQVLQSNSVDVSDYGNYDTSNIDKDIMVTVRASFTLK